MKKDTDTLLELKRQIEQLESEGRFDTPEYEKVSEEYQSLATCILIGNLMNPSE